MPSQRNQEAHAIQIEKILVESISTSLKYYRHYYVNIEEVFLSTNDSSNNSNGSTIAIPSTSQSSVLQPCNKFLRLPQIQGPRDCRVKMNL